MLRVPAACCAFSPGGLRFARTLVMDMGWRVSAARAAAFPVGSAARYAVRNGELSKDARKIYEVIRCITWILVLKELPVRHLRGCCRRW